MKKTLLLSAFAVCVFSAGAAVAQDSATDAAAPMFDRLPLYGSPAESAEPSATQQPAVTENPSLDRRRAEQAYDKKLRTAMLRQERALYWMKHRMARMERDAWLGHSPLRPRFHAIPTAASRYNQPTVLVPVYVR
ncbi:hypothetical protein [Crateriforma conspicua]|uniref:Uncharacterized protein n=1 Tax=Crateriforma conspicua TaxID=2527996 RepID=A0A5C5Y6J5_9PLAN|nr:hypothetical protein [Crateriforma conspicua]QDV65867.1 hypothetical protein Mal65_50400 [Crateriforma conspicua]TWT71267.1 hypothetical protein Pan14r_35770 [Crateriforma conspicua]